jgi:hypothetical protein
MRKALLTFLALIIFAGFRSSAQSMGSSYQTAVGIKFWPGAISVKHFISDNAALEGLATFWDNGFRVTGLYEIHGDVDNAPGLKWYIGPGAHIGAYNGVLFHDHYYSSGSLSLGIDGVVGLDYKINGAPIDLSLDIQPYLELAGHPYLDIWGGLCIRYTF